MTKRLARLDGVIEAREPCDHRRDPSDRAAIPVGKVEQRNRAIRREDPEAERGTEPAERRDQIQHGEIALTRDRHSILVGVVHAGERNERRQRHVGYEPTNRRHEPRMCAAGKKITKFIFDASSERASAGFARCTTSTKRAQTHASIGSDVTAVGLRAQVFVHDKMFFSYTCCVCVCVCERKCARV